MGEVAVSSEGGFGLERADKNNHKITGEGGGSTAAADDSSAVRWERFLPKMAVRVLLVEADDSTRQIISALLRKCSYRVAAVGDGLKAWEVLKGTPHNIDLILTEVELPAISGYALLTLIMEHEVCKNIPVIMMSSQDSVNTVYKCMLRGATDFLVKPVRKNELRNLWQHVWRKQASSTGAGLGHPDESIADEKEEATAENNATSNHSSGYMSSIQKNMDGIDKGSDAQSSCTKPGSQNEGEDIEHVHSPSKPKSAKCLSDGACLPIQEEWHQQNKKRRALEETGVLQAVANTDADHAVGREDKISDDICELVKAIGQNVKDNHFLDNSCREAIDLIGSFDNHPKGYLGTLPPNVSTNKFDVMPLLDLSLRRSNPSGSVKQVNNERPGLNHSDASPFSRYVNNPSQLSKSTSPSTCDQQKGHKTKSEKQPSNQAPDYKSETHGPIMNSHTVQTGRPEFTFSSYTQSRNISHPIPIRGVGFGNVINALPSACTSLSGSPPFPSPSTTHHSEPVQQSSPFYPRERQLSSSQQLHGSGDQTISSSEDQTEHKWGNKVEEGEDQGLVSPGNDWCGNSSFYNSNTSHHQSTAIKGASDCGSGNLESFHLHEGASHRSMQREAALTKFRMKRKERCFEKKVRYESRKKLAEQRPRVKGQFVRQLPNDPQPGNSSSG